MTTLIGSLDGSNWRYNRPFVVNPSKNNIFHWPTVCNCFANFYFIIRISWIWLTKKFLHGFPYKRSFSAFNVSRSQELSFYATNAQTPVKLRMAEGFPFDREPELVQTMVRRTVKNFPNNTAIAYKGNAHSQNSQSLYFLYSIFWGTSIGQKGISQA